MFYILGIITVVHNTIKTKEHIRCPLGVRRFRYEMHQPQHAQCTKGTQVPLKCADNRQRDYCLHAHTQAKSSFVSRKVLKSHSYCLPDHRASISTPKFYVKALNVYPPIGMIPIYINGKGLTFCGSFDFISARVQSLAKRRLRIEWLFCAPNRRALRDIQRVGLSCD
jgi:hypothetical protein